MTAATAANTIKDARSQRTRDVIIRAAEQLFAEQGVEAVSVNNITRAAGQSNRNAVQYHFGNKTGLLQAIFDKHSPQLTQRRGELIDKLVGRDLSPARLIATALIEPLLEKLADEDGGEAYIHISAELIASNTLGYSLRDKHPIKLPRETKLVRYAAQQLTDLPPAITRHRVLLMNVLAFHGLSDHARIRRNNAYDPLSRDTAFMASNLIDSMTAIIEATPSAQSLNLLARHELADSAIDNSGT